jgi:hypothetical protein
VALLIPFLCLKTIFHVPRHNPKGGLIPPLGIYILSLKNLCEVPLAAKHINVVYLKIRRPKMNRPSHALLSGAVERGEIDFI